MFRVAPPASRTNGASRGQGQHALDPQVLEQALHRRRQIEGGLAAAVVLDRVLAAQLRQALLRRRAVEHRQVLAQKGHDLRARLSQRCQGHQLALAHDPAVQVARDDVVEARRERVVDGLVGQRLDAAVAAAVDEVRVAEVTAAVADVDHRVGCLREGVHHRRVGQVVVDDQGVEAPAAQLDARFVQPAHVAQLFGQVLVPVGRAGHAGDGVDADATLIEGNLHQLLHLGVGAGLLLLAEEPLRLQHQQHPPLVGDAH